MDWLERTEILLGQDMLQDLKHKHILIVGLGGVGSYAAELIARAGVGNFTIVDGDTVNASNINRQLPALTSTINMAKADVVAQRLLDINPELNLTVINSFIDEDSFEELVSKGFDFVVDAIDTLSPKVALIKSAVDTKTPIISAMGAGGKFDPAQIKIADISKSEYCMLARSVRKRLYKQGIRKGVKVVFSTEEAPKEYVIKTEGERNKKSTLGTISYLPAMFGCYAASYVIRILTGK